MWRQIQPDVDDITLDLADWPEEVPQSPSGGPVGAATASWYTRQLGVDFIVWITSGESLAVRDSVAWVHNLEEGEVTAVLVVPSATTAQVGALAADALLEAMQTDDVEILVIPEGGGAPRRNSVVEARVRAVLHDAVLSEAVPLEQAVVQGGADPPYAVRFGAAVATGVGIATEVTDPGIAPTPLLARVDVSVALGPKTDLGVAGRFQITQPAVQAEVFARHRMRLFHLRWGFGGGNVVHKIVVTENRNRSTSGIAGPTLGVSIPLGVLELGLHSYVPVYPSPTVQLDASLGVGLDF